MPTHRAGTVISDHRAETVIAFQNADISGGRVVHLRNWAHFSIHFRNPGGPVTINVEVSPDNGATFFELEEGPVIMAGVNDAANINVTYFATQLRLTADSANAVTAIIRGLY